MSGRNVAEPSANNTVSSSNNSTYQTGHSTSRSATYLPLGDDNSNGASNAYPAIPAVVLAPSNPSSLPYLQSQSSSSYPQPQQYSNSSLYQHHQQPQYQQQNVSAIMTHSMGPSFNYNQTTSSTYYNAPQLPQYQQSQQFERNRSTGELSSTSSSSDNLSLLNPGFMEKKSEHDSKLLEPEMVSARTPVPMPELPNSFPELERLTTSQLERLNNDEAAIEVDIYIHFFLKKSSLIPVILLFNYTFSPPTSLPLIGTCQRVELGRIDDFSERSNEEIKL